MESEFIVESQGNCFLCLDAVPPQIFQIIKYEEMPPSSSEVLSISSLHSLSRYLGMNLHNVFTRARGQHHFTSPHSFDNGRNDILKCELCEKCALLNDNFAILHRKFEKIQIELIECLSQIFEEMMKPKNKEKLEGWKSAKESLVNSNPRLDLLDVLRNEAMEKCSLKLSATPPRVKLQNLSTEQTQNAKYLHSSSKDCGNYEHGLSKSNPDNITIKIEFPTNLIPQNEDKNWNPDDNLDAFSDTSTYLDLDTTTNNFDQTPKNSRRAKMQPKGINKIKPQRTRTSDVKIPEDSFTIENGKYKCCVCERKFTLVPSLRKHYRVFHLDFKFKCNVCGKEFRSSGACYTHRSTAHLGISFTCHICGRSFTNKCHLQRHQRVINCELGGAPNKKHTCHCKICGQGFTRMISLKRHLNDIHSKSPKNYSCDVCGKKFAQKSNLGRHQGNCQPKIKL